LPPKVIFIVRGVRPELDEGLIRKYTFGLFVFRHAGLDPASSGF
jgi:hypothetical protein